MRLESIRPSDTFLLSKRRWQWAALGAFGLEVALFSDLRNWFGPFWSPVAFYMASVLLCGCTIMAQLDTPPLEKVPHLESRRVMISWLILLLGGLAVAYVQGPVIQANPISPEKSDIIPVLQEYVLRFRSGEVVYRYITNLPYPLFPNYLPLQWLPYVLADQLGVDYRWWSLVLLLLGGFGAYLALVHKLRLPWPVFLAAAVLPWVLLRHLIKVDAGLFAHTVEFTIIAYYCLLAAAIFSRSVLLQAAGLLLCLLSRYSVIFWVPFFLWLLWQKKGHWHALLVAVLIALGIVLIYVVPFLSQDWTIFIRALRWYKTAILGEWSRTYSPDGKPYHLFYGLGFASWFYEFGTGDLAARIDLLQKVHLLASVGAVVLSAAAYWRLRSRLDYQIFALVSLSFYLSTFYAFIQVPYAYLTSLTLFISAMVVVVAWRPAVPGHSATD